ncbi:MAG: hypothetical protein M1114_03845 [Candidatus Dependentiae bacterium]|nr:hypothetical protein [Candidatus Dependentiae bacterium]
MILFFYLLFLIFSVFSSYAMNSLTMPDSEISENKRMTNRELYFYYKPQIAMLKNLCAHTPEGHQFLIVKELEKEKWINNKWYREFHYSLTLIDGAMIVYRHGIYQRDSISYLKKDNKIIYYYPQTFAFLRMRYNQQRQNYIENYYHVVNKLFSENDYHLWGHKNFSLNEMSFVKALLLNYQIQDNYSS